MTDKSTSNRITFGSASWTLENSRRLRQQESSQTQVDSSCYFGTKILGVVPGTDPTSGRVTLLDTVYDHTSLLFFAADEPSAISTVIGRHIEPSGADSYRDRVLGGTKAFEYRDGHCEDSQAYEYCDGVSGCWTGVRSGLRSGWPDVFFPRRVQLLLH